MISNMDGGGTTSKPDRKELRRQKLMEYLASKRKLSQRDFKLHPRNDSVKKPSMSQLKADLVQEKENQAPLVVSMGSDRTRSQSQTKKGIFCRTGTSLGKLTVQKEDALPTAPTISCPVLSTGPKRPTTVSQKTQPTRTYTIANLKSQLNATNQLRTQPNVRVKNASHPSSGKPLTLHKGQAKSATNDAKSVISTAYSVRTLGPFVKTKTGLIPAVVQPRNLKADPTTATRTTSIASRAPSTTEAGPASRTSATAHMNRLPTAMVNKPPQKRTIAPRTIGTEIRAPAQSKTRAKPVITRRPLPSSCLKESANTSKPRCPIRNTTAAVKARQQEGLAETMKSAAQPSGDRSEVRGTGAVRSAGTSSRASSGVLTRLPSQVVNRATAPGAERARKSKDCSRAVNKKEGGSTEVQPVPTPGPSMPQTVPRTAKSCRRGTWLEDMKTPKAQHGAVPQTERKRLTAAQEERMRKLQEWREAKGISYKRPPMPVKAGIRRTPAKPQPYWADTEENDEANTLIFAVDRSLADCVKMLEEGCSSEKGKEVLSRLPAVAKKFAKYWICQAHLMVQQGNYDILPMFEEAVRMVSEPVDELRTVVFEILKKKDEAQGPMPVDLKFEEKEAPSQGDQSPEGADDFLVTPKPVRALIFGNRGDSSVIKYKITATPGGSQSQKREPVRVNGQEVRFFTPVRRSVRIDRASVRYPSSLQDHDLCVASYNDIMGKEERGTGSEEKGGEASPSLQDTTMYVYRENEALNDHVHIQLVYSDD